MITILKTNQNYSKKDLEQTRLFFLHNQNRITEYLNKIKDSPEYDRLHEKFKETHFFGSY